MKTAIKKVCAREILDSRGNPTIEVDVTLADGSFGRAAVPSGASTGEYEAVELRDNDKRRYSGKGVLKAVDNVNKTIGLKIKGTDASKQSRLDRTMIEMDGTDNKSNLGANAILGVSLASAKAVANSKNIPLYRYISSLCPPSTFHLPPSTYILPIPLMNILNGGLHADNNLDIQEFMIMPVGAESFSQGLRMGAEVFHNLKSLLKSKGLITSVGDEGGFAPNLSDANANEAAIQTILAAIKNAGYIPGKDIYIALDVAASSLSEGGGYVMKKSTKEKKDSSCMISLYKEWLKKYPILLIEDGLGENDWLGWKALTEDLGDRCQLVGDDLFVTNTKLLKRGIEQKTANAVLIKVNQIGTLTETLEAIELALENNYKAIISHRSGETEDTTISHIAVGASVGQIKTGSVSRTDRVAKYNELLRIEEGLGKKAVYAGKLWQRKS